MARVNLPCAQLFCGGVLSARESSEAPNWPLFEGCILVFVRDWSAKSLKQCDWSLFGVGGLYLPTSRRHIHSSFGKLRNSSGTRSLGNSREIGIIFGACHVNGKTPPRPTILRRSIFPPSLRFSDKPLVRKLDRSKVYLEFNFNELVDNLFPFAALRVSPA